jgi:hypothetical protein
MNQSETEQTKRETQMATEINLPLDDEGYPTEEAERIVREFSGDARVLLEAIHAIWAHGKWGWNEEDGLDICERPVHRYNISTGGWSGNEALIEALRANIMFWMLFWVEDRRGGHFVFEVSEGLREFKAVIRTAAPPVANPEPIPVPPSGDRWSTDKCATCGHAREDHRNDYAECQTTTDGKDCDCEDFEETLQVEPVAAPPAPSVLADISVDDVEITLSSGFGSSLTITAADSAEGERIVKGWPEDKVREYAANWVARAEARQRFMDNAIARIRKTAAVPAPIVAPSTSEVSALEGMFFSEADIAIHLKNPNPKQLSVHLNSYILEAYRIGKESTK